MKQYGIDKEKESKGLLDVLLDGENREDITMTDENGQEYTFTQIAVIPYTPTGSLYALLAPVTPIEGIAEDELIVFRVDVTEEGETALNLEEDEDICQEVYQVYLQLLKDANQA